MRLTARTGDITVPELREMRALYSVWGREYCAEIARTYLLYVLHYGVLSII
jgi:hypothetical protein